MAEMSLLSEEKASPTPALKPAARARDRVPRASLTVTAAFAASASGCQVVEGIFKTGFWFGVITVIAVVALLLFALKKLAS
jgi:hypothetical protein